MTRRLFPAVFALAVLASFAWTLVFLYRRSLPKPAPVRTVVLQRMNIVLKTVAPGSIVPRREVALKPRVSGVVEKLYVQPGDSVKQGERIATIKIMPNVVNLNTAEARLTTAEINLANMAQEYGRSKKLSDLHLLDQGSFAHAELEYALAKQEVTAADNNLQLVRGGFAVGTSKISNVVTSTMDGMVTEVPVKEGGTVTEANTFNDGTTVASVADMSDLVFVGDVDETDVGKLKLTAPVTISIGALEHERFGGTLEYISPKGVDKDGTTQFEIRVKVELKRDVFIRSHYGANAEIVLEERDDVLALSENVIEFADGKAYVNVEVGPIAFAKRGIELGLSDGFNVQVISGLVPTERVKESDVLGSAPQQRSSP